MSVLLCRDTDLNELKNLLGKFNLKIFIVDSDNHIPGSWFGDSEAGLINNQLHIRMDTPVHSALHESCHYICMPDSRRKQLHTNAGGNYDEENAVCYLQILLADHIKDFGRDRIFKDMDEWGYTFRLGSSRAWFESDAEDAKQSLINWHIIDEKSRVLWQLRQ